MNWVIFLMCLLKMSVQCLRTFSEGWHLEHFLPCWGKYNLIRIPQFISLAHDDRLGCFETSQERKSTNVRVKINIW